MSENRYQVIHLIGEGKTGRVYAAEDTNLNRKVVIRRFYKDDTQFDFTDYKEEFGEVSRSLSNCHHPNFAKVFDIGVDDEGAFMVLQLLEGESLHEVLKRGAFDTHEVTEIAKQILDAFAQSHGEGYYHGALVLDSIMMIAQNRGGYRYIILDMGLAKISSLMFGEKSALQNGMKNLAIIAPELFEGKEADARTDLYMLGQILYMTLAGGHPYASLTLDKLKAKHSEGLPSISNYNANVPEDLKQWLTVMVNVDPAKRYSSAVEALEQLPEIRPDAQKIATQLTQVGGVTSEGSPLTKTGSIQANPIKKRSVVQALSHVSAPVPISAPGAQQKESR